MDCEQFDSDKKSQQAVIYSLLIVGEAAKKIMDCYPEFATANPRIPWRNMRVMRSKFAYGYFDINLDVVWETVKIAVPDLLVQIDKHT